MEGNCEHVPLQRALGGGLPGTESMHPLSVPTGLILTKEYFCQKHGHTCIDKIVLKIVRAYGFSERHPLSLNTDLSLETRHLALSGDD
jgi:hypothetical protein